MITLDFWDGAEVDGKELMFPNRSESETTQFLCKHSRSPETENSSVNSVYVATVSRNVQQVTAD